MDSSEFLSLKNLDALNEKIEELHENLLKKNKGKRNRKALEEFQEAIEQLEKWFVKMKTDSKFAIGSAEGGAPSKYKRRYATEDRADKLLKQMALRHRSKLLFLRGFSKGLYQRYDGVLRAVNALGPRVGREIPTGPKMEDLMDAFRRLAIRNLRSSDMDLALIGIENNVVGREIKESLISSLKLITRKVDEVLAAKDYSGSSSYFSALKSSIDEIIKYIERYNELRKLKFGAANEAVDSTSTDLPAEPDLPAEAEYVGYGSSDDESPKEGGSIEREWDTKDAYSRYKQTLDGYTPKDSYKLEEAVGKMMYFYYVAGVRENLKMASTELSHYGKNYDEVLNSAMAVRKAEISRERDIRLEKLELDYEHYFRPKITPAGGSEHTVESLMTDDEYDMYKDMINASYDARINLYKAIEAIELYLKDYTRVIASNPDIIKDLKKVLESNNNIFNWFNNESGDALTNAFDSATYDDISKTGVSLATNVRALKKMLGAIDEVKDSDNHYYVRWMKDSVDDLITKAGASNEAKAYEKALKGGAAATKKPKLVTRATDPINNSTGSKENYDAVNLARDYVEYAVNSFQALQNIMNSFIMIANVTNSGEVKKIMAPRQIYKLLINYILASAFVLGVNDTECNASWAKGVAKISGRTHKNFADFPTVLSYKNEKGEFTTLGVSLDDLYDSGKAAINKESLKKRESDAADNAAWKDEAEYVAELKKRWASYKVFFGFSKPDATTNRYAHIGNDFQKENVFFSYALKAIVGKILVTIGVYDFINRDEAPLDTIRNPQVRFILGGDDDKPPVVRPQLAELYYRVPRLMETYRETLEMGSAPWQVTMIVDPEMRFVDFFEFMFEELEYDTVVNGGYSTQECWRLIKFINELHDEIKGEPRDVINELYKEVNRRYNIIKREEMARSKKLKQWRHKADYSDDRATYYSRNQIDILPEDDLHDFAMVPSDHYMLPEDPKRNTKVDLDKKLLYKIDEDPDDGRNTSPGIWTDRDGGLNHYLIIRDFRDKINGYFNDVDFTRYTRNVYKNVIDQYRTEMQNAKSEAEKVAIAVRLVSTDSRMTSIDSRKLMAFHETVVYGLNVLNGLHNAVTTFMEFCKGVSFEEFKKKVRTLLMAAGGNNANTIDWGRSAATGVRDMSATAGYPYAPAHVFDDIGALEKYAMSESESYNGRAGLHPHATYAEVMRLITTSVGATPVGGALLDEFIEQLWRLGYRNEDMMRDILLNIFNFGFDMQGLVKVEFSHTDNRVTIFANELRDLALNLLSDVRQFLEIFRAHLPDSVIAEYEHGKTKQGALTIDGSPEPGTLYFLAQEFVDKIFRRSEDDFEYIDTDRTKLSKTFNQHVRMLNDTVVQLTKKYNADAIMKSTLFHDGRAYRTIDTYGYANPGVARSAAVETGVVTVPIFEDLTAKKAEEEIRNKRVESDEYGQTIAEILFYNMLKVDSGVRGGALRAVDSVDWKQMMDHSMAMLDDPEWKAFAILNGDPNNRNSDISGLGFSDKLPFLLWKHVVMDIKTGQPSMPALKKFTRRGKGPSRGTPMTGYVEPDVSTNIIEPNSRFSERFPLTMCTHKMYDFSGLENHNSLMYLFNQYLVWFLNTMYDRTNFKIYGQLMKSFISGPLSSIIANCDVSGNAKVYPDMLEFESISDLATFCQRGDPASGVTLLQSVALMLKTLIISKGPEGHAFLVQNSADLPGYYKENMKLNLPIFLRLFDYVSKFSTFIKDAMLGMDLNVSRYSINSMLTSASTAIAPDARIMNLSLNGRTLANAKIQASMSDIAKVDESVMTPYVIGWSGIKTRAEMGAVLSNDSARTTFEAFMNSISSAADAAQKSCREVLRELVDDHVYMEISDGFITNYKSKSSGKTPIMPLSSSLHQLRSPKADQERLLPTSSVSDPRFRYMYSQRHLYLYDDKPEASEYPYIASMLADFNTLVAEGDKISESRYLAFASKTIDASRFLANFAFFKGAYGVLSTINNLGLWSAIDPTAGIVAPDRRKLVVYQLQSKFRSINDESVLEISETVDQRRKLGEITKEITLVSQDFANSRKKEQQYNIIDMNIVPFNPSGFMREVPLTNLYNYCYTFEEMMCNMFKIGDKDRIRAPFNDFHDPLMIPITGTTATSPAAIAKYGARAPEPRANVKETFVNLLLRPYAEVDEASVYGNVSGKADVNLMAPLQRIFRGDNSLNLGTPKFLSDQIFNKVLFQSVYPRSMAAFNEEGGPMYSLGRLLNPGDRSRTDNEANMPFTQANTDTILYNRRPDILSTTDAYALTFPYRSKDKEKKFAIQSINVPEATMVALLQHGFDRFNTNIVRNLFFITNLYRVLRLKLNQELVQTRSMIVSTDNLVTPAITEYGASKTGHTEVFDDNEIDSAYPAYDIKRRSYM
jgi:hypothetical protein